MLEALTPSVSGTPYARGRRGLDTGGPLVARRVRLVTPTAPETPSLVIPTLRSPPFPPGWVGGGWGGCNRGYCHRVGSVTSPGPSRRTPYRLRDTSGCLVNEEIHRPLPQSTDIGQSLESVFDKGLSFPVPRRTEPGLGTRGVRGSGTRVDRRRTHYLDRHQCPGIN